MAIASTIQPLAIASVSQARRKPSFSITGVAHAHRPIIERQRQANTAAFFLSAQPHLQGHGHLLAHALTVAHPYFSRALIEEEGHPKNWPEIVPHQGPSSSQVQLLPAPFLASFCSATHSLNDDGRCLAHALTVAHPYFSRALDVLKDQIRLQPRITVDVR